MAYKFQLGAATLSGSLTQEGDITGEGNLALANSATIGCAADADLITLANTAVTFASNADVNVAKAGGLQIAGAAVTSTAAELNLLDTSVGGSIVNGKAVIYGDAGEVRASKLEIDGANDYIDVSTDLQLIAAADILLDPGGSDVKVDGNVVPNSDDGGTLGSANLNWSDAYFADGAVLNFGDDQEIKLTHNADTSLTLSSAVDDFQLELKGEHAGANAVSLVLHRSSSSPADDDVLGKISTYGYDDGGNYHTFGEIAISAVDVSAGAEQGKMEFKVAEFDGTSTTGLSLEGQASDGVINVTIGAGAASTTTIAGNLTINGTTTTVNSTTINITSSFTFEGPADDYETTLNTVDATADRTVSLPNQSGVLAILDPSLSDSELATAITSGPSELNLLDGSAKSTSSITIADADGFIIIDGTTTKQIPASDIKTYIGSSANLDVALKDNTETLATGVNYFADLGGAEAANLPASPSVGDSVYVKAPSNCSTSNTLTINRQGSHTIDGETAIVLESPHAAVMLVYVVANTWKVF